MSVTSHTIRKASEDGRLRPFLSSHFDAQSFITGIIRDNKTDEFYNELASCIQDVSDEIKGYITHHKHDLMSGMQDVARLSSQYSALKDLSSQLQKSVEKHQLELTAAYTALQSKTIELERIHQTNVILRQLRQFLHSKTQLDNYLQTTNIKSHDNLDLRQFAIIAKTIHELETIISTPNISSLALVSQHSSIIRTVGLDIRTTAQNQLMHALNHQNQAAIADCLQIFVNLRSLSEVVIFATDQLVNSAYDMSMAILDMDVLGSSGNSNRNTPNKKLSESPAPTVTSRVALREMVHQWSTAIQNQASKMHVLHRVVLKKEDPNTHIRFMDILKNQPQTHLDSLLDFFWARLSVSLQELISEKMKSNSVMCLKLYPALRRSAFDIYRSISALERADHIYRVDEGFNDDNEVLEEAVGLFNSMSISPYTKTRTTSVKSSTTPMNSGDSEQIGLLVGLKPLRDKYLAYALSRMNAPVLQMFPEMEGYMAAIPSRRDLLTLVKAIQEEVVTVLTDGENTLVALVAKEALKALRLFVTKVESMVLTAGPDSVKITKTAQFQRTSQQEHNSQLVLLLSQLKESLGKIVNQIIKSTRDATSSVLASHDSSSIEDLLHKHLSPCIESAIQMIDELTVKQLLQPIIDSLSNYCKSILLGVLREGTSTQQDVIDCCPAVNAVIQQFPEAVNTYLLHLPNTLLENVCDRIMHSYITTAALIKPVTEQVKLRVAAEMSALELMMTALRTQKKQSKPSFIADEFKAYRRLIFDDRVIFQKYPGPTTSSSQLISDTHYPNISGIQSLTYLHQLRPSTLLGFLCSCGPSQLPQPCEFFGSPLMNKDPVDYISALTNVNLDEVSVSRKWRQIAVEKKAMDLVLQCADVLSQRSINADETHKQHYRLWYEGIVTLVTSIQ